MWSVVGWNMLQCMTVLLRETSWVIILCNGGTRRGDHSAVSVQVVYSGRCQFCVSVLGPSWGTPGDGNLLDMRIFHLAVTARASPLISSVCLLYACGTCRFNKESLFFWVVCDFLLWYNKVFSNLYSLQSRRRFFLCTPWYTAVCIPSECGMAEFWS